MIWTDSICQTIIQYMHDTPGATYLSAAKKVSSEFNESIHPEQLRGALRRYTARQRQVVERSELYTPEVLVIDEPRPRVREIDPIVPIQHTPRGKKPQRIRFGAIGDTHLASRYEDLEALHGIFEIFRQEGVTDVYHTGNFIDGEARFNLNDLKVRGMDGQLRYFVENYPHVEGITTHYIAGDDHEGWYVQSNGVEIGEHLEDISRRMGRTDLKYLGYMEADVPIIIPGSEPRIMRVLHAGGGSSYALSHTSQKIVDSYDDAERPFLLLVGHYHKAEYLPNYRGVRIIQTGTFQRQTPFMRKKRLHADIGGWIVDIALEGEASRVSAEFIHFAHKPWKYEVR